jgi:hypothetical protein
MDSRLGYLWRVLLAAQSTDAKNPALASWINEIFPSKGTQRAGIFAELLRTSLLPMIASHQGCDMAEPWLRIGLLRFGLPTGHL